MPARRRLRLLAAALLALTCREAPFEPRGAAGQIDLDDDLYSVSAPDEEHVVAVGYWGAIYVSRDGGASWRKAESGTERSLYGVSMADPRRGWAVGQRGLILRTADGGATWARQRGVEARQHPHLFSVHAVDTERAWAVGEWGTRIYTDDGGRTWRDHSLRIDRSHPQYVWLSPSDRDRVRRGEAVFEDVSLNDVSCLAGGESCWVVGEFGTIFRSSTGGIGRDGRPGWERGRIAGSQSLGAIELRHGEVEFGEEERAMLRQLAEGLAEQEHLDLGIEPRVSPGEIRDFRARVDPEPLFELIEARGEEVRALLEDAGVPSERIRRRGSPPWDYEDFLAEDPDFLERYLEGRRAGRPGVEIAVGQSPFLFAIRFEDPDRGLISGLGGVVLRSADGGATWHYGSVGQKLAVFSVQPLGQAWAIAIGERGLVRYSRDGGSSWTASPDALPPVPGFLRDVAFAPRGRVGYLVGERALVMRSTDAGERWTRVFPPGDAD